MRHLFIVVIVAAFAGLAMTYHYMFSVEATWGYVQPALVMLSTAVCTLFTRAAWMSLARGE